MWAEDLENGFRPTKNRPTAGTGVRCKKEMSPVYSNEAEGGKDDERLAYER